MTREELLNIIETDHVQCGEAAALARMALAALDSDPVAWLLSGGGAKNVVCFDSGNAYADPLREVTPLYRHAQPAPNLKPVGYLFVSDQGAIVYSPTDWGMPGFRLVGQIYGDIDVESQPVPVVLDSGREPVITQVPPSGMLKIGYMFITAEGGTVFSISDTKIPNLTLAGPVYVPVPVPQETDHVRK